MRKFNASKKMLFLLLSTLKVLVILPSTFCLEAQKPNVYEFHSTLSECSKNLVKDTTKVSEAYVQSLLDCARHCATENYCDLAVYWKSPDGKVSCTKLARTEPLPHTTRVHTPELPEHEKVLERADFSVCRVLKVNRCQNGGYFKSKDNVCQCKHGYLGEICEFRGSYCDPGRYQAYKYYEHLLTSELSVPGLEFVARNSEHTVKIFDQNLRADIYMTGGKSYHGETDLTLSTSESVELSSWDSFADPVRREFSLFGLHSSERVLVTVSDDKKQQWERKNLGRLFSIFSLEETRFRARVPQGADYKEVLLEHLWKGHEVRDSNYATGDADVEEDSVEYQLSGVELKTSPGYKSFETPVTFLNTLTKGLTKTKFVTLGVGGQDQGLEQPAADLRLNPCWFQPLNDFQDIPESVFRQKLISSLQIGHRIRIRTKAVFYAVQEVRQTYTKVIFILAPHIEGQRVTQMTISADKHVELMYCNAETTAFRRTRNNTLNFLKWFADARAWKKVLTVRYRNRVTFGSVSDLVAQIESGADIRVWLHWLGDRRSRYLDINKRLVTEDKKVSAVSVVSSQVLEVSGFQLTRTCGLETVLVTSEGIVKVMRFNVDSTERTEEAITDALVEVTWFVN